MYDVEIVSGESPLRNVHIEDEVIVIGSLPDCDIQLEGDEIADKHLALEVKQGRMRIYDLAKSDSLLLNGIATREGDIKHGDNIDLGGYRLRVLLDQGGEAASPQPVDEHRPLSPLHVASLGSVGLMLTLQLVFIFFVSMRWRNSEIAKEVVPQIRLAQSPSPASVPPAPKPTAPVKPPTPPPEQSKPAQTRPATPPKDIEPSPPKSVVPKPAAPKPAAPKPAAPKPAAPQPAPATSVVSEPAPSRPEIRKPAAVQAPEKVVKTSAPAVAKPAAPKPQIRKPAVATPRESIAKPPAPVVTQPAPAPPATAVSPATTPARPTLRPKTDPKPVPDPLALEKTMLAEARGLIQKRDWNAADRVLERLQIINPKFTEAYVARARLFEVRRILPEAVKQWEVIIARGPRHPAFSEAVRSRERLTSLIKQAGSQPARVQGTKPVVPADRKISISAVEIQRYDKNERFDEMRLLTILLQPRSASQRLAGSDVTVEVAFYDEDLRSGRIALTKALVPESLFQLSGRIRLSEPPNLNAAYVVPKGFRKKQRETINSDMRFYGYRIQIFYKGVLQHQVAKPASLLSVEL